MQKTQWLVAGVLLTWASASAAVVKPESVHSATAQKTEGYVRDGLFVGGDRAVTGVVVRDIRRASNAGFERIVIDLEGSLNGEPLAIDRAPYFQVAVNRDERRLILTLWGNPRLSFDAKKVLAAFKKSVAVSQVELLPRVDDETWTFALNLKQPIPVEVFELKAPVRLIVDLKGGSR